MRKLEKYLEKKRWKKGGSNGENLRKLEKKRNCPFDAKKVCPVTTNPHRAIGGDFYCNVCRNMIYLQYNNKLKGV